MINCPHCGLPFLQTKKKRGTECPECGCPKSYHFRDGKPTGCVMADAGGGNCACTYYRKTE